MNGFLGQTNSVRITRKDANISVILESRRFYQQNGRNSFLKFKDLHLDLLIKMKGDKPKVI